MKKHLRWLSVVLVIFFVLPFLPLYGTVQAQAFVEPAIPAFGIVTDAQITSESVTVDIDGFKPSYQSNFATIESVYKATPPQDEYLEFFLPFIGKATDTVKIAVTVDDEPIVGNLLYGDSYILTDDTPDLRKIVESTITPNLTGVADGTLYKFIPTESTLSIDMRFDGEQSIIYDRTNSSSSSMGQGYYNLKLNNAVPMQAYYFFIVNGDFSEPPVTNAEYSKQTLSCKAYVDGFFEDFGDVFREIYPNVTQDFFYAEMRRLVGHSARLTTDDFFFGQLSNMRGNAYHFSVPNPGTDTVTVSVKQKARVQINNGFEPFIFMIRYVQAEQHPTQYVLRLNEAYPFLLESNLPFDNEQADFYKCNSQSSTAASYFVFGSSETPIDRYAQIDNQKKRDRNTVLAICIPIAAIALLVLIFNIVLIVKKKNY